MPGDGTPLGRFFASDLIHRAEAEMVLGYHQRALGFVAHIEDTYPSSEMPQYLVARLLRLRQGREGGCRGSGRVGGKREDIALRQKKGAGDVDTAGAAACANVPDGQRLRRCSASVFACFLRDLSKKVYVCGCVGVWVCFYETHLCQILCYCLCVLWCMACVYTQFACI
jgi:hypothetical protein